MSLRQTYIVVLATWVATVVVQVLLYDGTALHLIGLVPALVASAYVAGLRSGLPATALAALAALALGRGAIEGIDWPDWAALVATGAAASFACELLHRGRRRAEHARDHEHRTKLVLLEHLSEQRQVGDRVRQTLQLEPLRDCTDEVANARPSGLIPISRGSASCRRPAETPRRRRCYRSRRACGAPGASAPS